MSSQGQAPGVIKGYVFYFFIYFFPLEAANLLPIHLETLTSDVPRPAYQLFP